MAERAAYFENILDESGLKSGIHIEFGIEYEILQRCTLDECVQHIKPIALVAREADKIGEVVVAQRLQLVQKFHLYFGPQNALPLLEAEELGFRGAHQRV